MIKPWPSNLLALGRFSWNTFIDCWNSLDAWLQENCCRPVVANGRSAETNLLLQSQPGVQLWGRDPAQLYEINLTKWNFDLAWLNLLWLTVQPIQSVRNKQFVLIMCDLQKPTTMENKTANWVWTFLNYLANLSKKALSAIMSQVV